MNDELVLRALSLLLKIVPMDNNLHIAEIARLGGLRHLMITELEQAVQDLEGIP